MNEYQSWIKQTLQSGGVPVVDALLSRVPVVSTMVQGVGPFANRWDRQTWTVGRLAAFLATPRGIALRVSHTNRVEYQLMALALWHGGTLDRTQAAEETGLSVAQLEQCRQALIDLLLVNPDRGWLTLHAVVADLLHPPAPLVRPGVSQVVSRDIAIVLENLGVVAAGERKWERVDALEAALRDRDVVLTALSRLDPVARTVFEELVSSGGEKVRSILDRHDYRHYNERHEAIRLLLSFGLIGIGYDDVATVWLDVRVALSGALFDTWEMIEPATAETPPGGVPATLPTVVGTFDRLLTHVRASPAPALQGGGLGVKAVRAIAKALDLPSPVIGLLAAIAIELKLLGHATVEDTGRGRNRRVKVEWRTTPAAEEWALLPSVARWERLVSGWQSSIRIPVSEKPVERHDLGYGRVEYVLVRELCLRRLAELPVDGAIGRGDLVDWLEFRHGSFADRGALEQLVTHATVLGLLTEGEPTSPTRLGRGLIAGADLDQLVEAGSETFVVQADHTVIAPPDLDPDVAAQLSQMARLESDAGARIYRIDEQSLMPAHDSGMTGDEIVEFLASHSQVEVPQTVARTIQDASSRHGMLRVGASSTWVACDDPAIMAQAVSVRAAKLTLVTATAAVSELPRAKVMAALRAAGLASVDTAVEAAPEPPAVPTWADLGRPPAGAPPRLDTVEVAEQLLAGGIPSPLAETPAEGPWAMLDDVDEDELW